MSDDTKTKISDALTGQNHTEETKTIMSEAKKGEKNPMFGKTGENNPNYGKTPSEETRKKISNALLGNTNGKNQPTSQVIEVTDIKNNTTDLYDSIREAARVLNLPNFNIIINYIKNNQVKPYKGQYTFKKI